MNYQEFIHIFVFQTQMISGNILSAQPNLNTFIYPTIKFQIDLARFFSLFQHLIFNDRNTGKALYFKHFTLSIMCFSQQTYALHMCRKKRNTAIPPRYRHVLKKGDFNTPPVNPFFKKENGGFDFDISRLLFSNFAQICC